MYRALKTFCGKISMYEGEVRELSDKDIIKDLLHCKYIEEVKPAKKKGTKKTPKGE